MTFLSLFDLFEVKQTWVYATSPIFAQRPSFNQDSFLGISPLSSNPFPLSIGLTNLKTRQFRDKL